MNHIPCFFDTKLTLSKIQNTIEEGEFSPAVISHWKSMRIREGETIQIINGQGLVATFKVENIKPKFKLKTLEHRNFPQLEPKIDLFFSPPLASAFEECFQLGTEIGLNSFSILRTQHNQYKKDQQFKNARIERILESACAQCVRPWKPLLNLEWKSVSEAMKIAQGFKVFCNEGLAAHKIGLALKLKNNQAHNNHYSIFIGPEGGWSFEETQFLEKHCDASLSLGELILRVPTAITAATFFLRMNG
jgi:16S rRNA (uracil1498-N3)-methyltransferase